MTSIRDCTPCSASGSSSQQSLHQYNTRSACKRRNDCVTSLFCNPRHSPASIPTQQSSPIRRGGTRRDWFRKLMNCCDIGYGAASRTKKSRFNCCHLIEGIFLVGLAFCFFNVMTGYNRISSDIDGLRTELKLSTAKKIPKSKMGKACQEALKCREPTGRADFALQTSGGRIIRIVDTTNHLPSKTVYGVELCEGANGPSSMIQSSTAPGECWAFSGSRGRAIIRLSGTIRIDAVSLEHIPLAVSPTGSVDTAPKEFKIYGLEHGDGRGEKLLGTFQYDADGDPIQTFPVQNKDSYYRYISFEVLSNHGNRKFTCVYRLRVHGTLPGKDKLP